MACDAYESDTSERDVPTAEDFLHNRPVKVVLGPVRARHKALNRKGRAVLRIMRAHGWSANAMAEIFRVGTATIARQAARYGTRDEPKNDYDYAGADFLLHFPPKERKQVARKTSLKRRATSSPPPSMDSDYDDMPPPSPSLPPSSPLAAFLHDELGLSGSISLFSPPLLALFMARGFTVDAIRSLSHWPEPQLIEVTRRLLMYQIGTDPKLDAFQIVVLETAILRLGAGATQSPPRPTSTLRTAPSLPSFLTSVRGFSFTAHLPLFLAHRFTLERLRDELGLLSASGHTAAVYEIFARMLQAGSEGVVTTFGRDTQRGLSPLEVIVLEMALRA